MTYIRFNVAPVRHYLFVNDHVYTLREWNAYPKTCIAVYDSKNGQLNTIGKVSVTKITEVDQANTLIPYVNESGFTDISEWWNTACGIHKTSNFTLYLVKLSQ